MELERTKKHVTQSLPAVLARKQVCQANWHGKIGWRYGDLCSQNSPSTRKQTAQQPLKTRLHTTSQYLQ